MANKYALIDKTGKVLLDIECENVTNFSNNRSVVYTDNYYEILDKKSIIKKISIEKYMNLYYFQGGFARIASEENDTWGLCGFIDLNGNEIVKPIYDSVQDFNEGFAIVSKNDKYGFINTQGEEIVKMEYDSIQDFNEGFAIVSKEDKYGFIDAQGKEIVKIEYDSIEDFNEGFAIVFNNDKYGFLDTKGNMVYTSDYDSLIQFTNNVSRVLKNDKYGLINKDFFEILAPKYDYISDFISNYAIVEIDGKYGIISLDGIEIMSPVFEDIKIISDKLFAFYKEDKWSLSDFSGNIIIDSEFDNFKIITDNLIGVEKDESWYIINQLGVKVINNSFSQIRDFQDEVCWLEYSIKDEVNSGNSNSGNLEIDIISNGYEIFSIEFNNDLDLNDWYKKQANNYYESNKENDDFFIIINENFHLLINSPIKIACFPKLENIDNHSNNRINQLKQHYRKQKYQIQELEIIISSEFTLINSIKKEKVIWIYHSKASIQYIWYNIDEIDVSKIKLTAKYWKDDELLLFDNIIFENQLCDEENDQSQSGIGYEGPWQLTKKGLKKL